MIYTDENGDLIENGTGTNPVAAQYFLFNADPETTVLTATADEAIADYDPPCKCHPFLKRGFIFKTIGHRKRRKNRTPKLQIRKKLG